MQILFHHDATIDLEQAALFYEEHKPGLGGAFVSEVEAVCRRIHEYPELGAAHKGTEFRRVLLHRFPYIVFYLVEGRCIWIVAVAHNKRRPDFWKRRLKSEG